MRALATKPSRRRRNPSPATALLSGALVVAALVVLADPALAQARDNEGTSLFDGFGVGQLLVLALVVLATMIALIAFAWLLVLLTGADRDYLEVPAEPVGVGVPATAAAARRAARATPRSVARSIRPSTWVGLGVVALLAAVTVVWLGRGGDDNDPDDTATNGTGAPGLSCDRVPFLANRLPDGFSGGLRLGTGTEDPTPADRCVWHWSSPNGVIQLLGQSQAATGSPGQVDVDGKRIWVQGTLDGSTQVVFEERSFGGSAEVWYTLLSRAVDRDALVALATSLQRCQGSACNAPDA